MDKKEMREKATSASYPPPTEAPTKAGRRILKKFTEDLPVRLTKKELRLTADQLNHQLGERRSHEAHAANVKAELKAREASIDAQIEALSLRYDGKTQLRQVQCRDEADFHSGTVETIREDTGEVVRHRPLQTGERQEKIQFAPDDEVMTTHLLPQGAASLEDDGEPEVES